MCMNIGYGAMMQLQLLNGENIELDSMAVKTIAVKIKMNFVIGKYMMKMIEIWFNGERKRHLLELKFNTVVCAQFNMFSNSVLVSIINTCILSKRFMIKNVNEAVKMKIYK